MEHPPGGPDRPSTFEDVVLEPRNEVMKGLDGFRVVASGP